VRTAQTIVLAALTFVLAVSAAEPLPHYEIIELGLPSPSAAIDVNDRNEVVGTIGLTGSEVGFLWKEGSFTLLTGFEGQAQPHDINNLGVVVGSSLSNGVMRAWGWSNSVNIDLSDGLTNASVASAVNDQGDIVGVVSNVNEYPKFYILSEPIIQLSQDVVLGVEGGTPPLDGAIHAINDNRFVAARFLGSGVLYTSLTERSFPEYLAAFPNYLAPQSVVRAKYDALGLNSSNDVAGWIRLFATRSQPAVWRTNEWTILPSSLASDVVADAINDSGVLVGTMSSPKKALIWKDGAGADLDGLVDLPSGAHLSSAIAINSAGFIAANLVQGEIARAVLLKPVRAGVMPTMQLQQLADPILRTNKITIRVDTTFEGTPQRQVLYTLYRRLHFEKNSGAGRYWKEYQTVPIRTNISVGPDLSTTFDDLDPATYILSAELHDTNALALYSTPLSFVVTGLPKLNALRVNWDGNFDFSLLASPGQEHALEESSDFLTWTRVPGIVTTGGGISLPATNGSAHFYRTVVASNGLDIDESAEGYLLEAPTTIANRDLGLYLDGRGSLFFKIGNDGTFVANDYRGVTVLQGTYNYTAGRDTGRLILQSPNQAVKYDLELEFPFVIPDPFAAGNPVKVRGTLTNGDDVSSVAGTVSGI
jgi:uncharacterized membrane protein